MHAKGEGTLFSYGPAKKSIYKNPKVLDTRFVPNILHGRDDEVNKLQGWWEGALKGRPTMNVMLYGTSGSGKTVVVKHVKAALQKMALTLSRPVRVAYATCATNQDIEGGVVRVLLQLIHELDPTTDIPERGLSYFEYYAHLWRAIDAIPGQVIVILDEIDKLSIDKFNNVLYNLTRAGENGYITKSDLSITGITNNCGLAAHFDSKVQSSFHPVSILFSPYSGEALRTILTYRASQALEDGVVSEDIIAYIAQRSAKEHGDARLAIHLLQLAAEHAENRASEVIATEDVEWAQVELDRTVMVDAVKQLGIHQRLVLYTILTKNKDHTEKVTMETREVIASYRRLCDLISVTPISNTMVSKALTQLAGSFMLDAAYFYRGRGKGNTRLFSLAPNIPRDTLEKVAKEDLTLHQEGI
jgi:cell division control protein 6